MFGVRIIGGLSKPNKSFNRNNYWLRIINYYSIMRYSVLVKSSHEKYQKILNGREVEEVIYERPNCKQKHILGYWKICNLELLFLWNRVKISKMDLIQS